MLKFLAALILGLLATQPALGREDVLAKLAAQDKKILSLAATITVRSMAETLEKKVIRTGKFYYKSPNLFKIEWAATGESSVLIRGNNRYRLDDKKRKPEKLLPLGVLAGYYTLPAIIPNPVRYLNGMSYLVQELEGGKYLVSGVPKVKTPPLGRVNFYLDPKFLSPVRLAIYNEKKSLTALVEIEYRGAGGVWVGAMSRAVLTEKSGLVNLETELTDIRVNRKLSPAIFEK